MTQGGGIVKDTTILETVQLRLEKMLENGLFPAASTGGEGASVRNVHLRPLPEKQKTSTEGLL